MAKELAAMPDMLVSEGFRDPISGRAKSLPRFYPAASGVTPCPVSCPTLDPHPTPDPHTIGS